MRSLNFDKGSLVIGIYVIIATTIIILVFDWTNDSIILAEKQAAQRALIEVVPHGDHDNDLIDDVITIPNEPSEALGSTTSVQVFIAKKNDQIVTLIVPATTTTGYGGDIKMAVGINIDGSISGVRILSHNETPGLGDKIDLSKSRWILSFDHKSLTNPDSSRWQIKKDGGDFDQIAGATITSRAVVTQVRDVLSFIDRHREFLIKEMDAHAQK